jgi:hypothetical protein
VCLYEHNLLLNKVGLQATCWWITGTHGDWHIVSAKQHLLLLKCLPVTGGLNCSAACGWGAEHGRASLKQAHFAPCLPVSVEQHNGAPFCGVRSCQVMSAPAHGQQWRPWAVGCDGSGPPQASGEQ